MRRLVGSAVAKLADQAKAPSGSPLRVPRRATSQGDGGSPETRLLADSRGLDAYVLLGDPGAGKSCSFAAEASACDGLLIAARDIVDGVATAPVGDEIVFIDGLDEVRAGAADSKTPFGAIRAWLHQQGSPRFRLSCREADWLGDSDRSALARVAPGRRVEVLHLEPLQREDQLAVLRSRPAEVSNPEAFWRKAEQFRLTALFGNPLLLDLTIKAVTQDGEHWPATRQGIYEAACRQLAAEASTEHLALTPTAPGDIDRLLDDAGLLCAVLLLSNKQACALGPGGPRGAVDLNDLPAVLPLHDARAALKSKVFTNVAGQCTPRHRSIAEFLAAKALAKRLDAGLPLGRLLALMQGFDGRPVEPLRGLFAWLVVHHLPDRARLIQLDPLGVVLNGDVAALGKTERLAVLVALGEAARQDRWFRRDAWVSHPFGPLATVDMAPTYEDLLRAPARDDAHQAFMDCVLDALRHGERMPILGPALAVWVEDATVWFGNRLAAYEAWTHNVDAALQPALQKAWLAQLQAGTVADSDDRLMSALLTDLYPNHLGPREVLAFLRPHRRSHVIAEYSTFWRHVLLRRSRQQDFAELADGLVDIKETSPGDAQDFQRWEMCSEVLAAAVTHAGEGISTERLYAWLGICLDEHGFSKLTGDAQKDVTQWLEARPSQIKVVVALGYQLTQPNAQEHRFYWQAEQRLHGARVPPDWLRWQLDIAATTADDALAQYCFRQVALTIFNPPAGFDVPTMVELEQWVDAHAAKRPALRDWLKQAWTSNLYEWQGDHHRRQLKYKAEQLQARDERKRNLQPHWSALASGTAPDGLLQQLAFAHDERFSDIHGDTPLDRVQDFLGSDRATAEAALAGLDHVLTRDGLPSVDEILDVDAKGQYHPVRPAALLAAARKAERMPDAPLSWPDDLAQKLVAFYLTDGLGNMPDWYRHLVVHRPGLVAPVLLRYANPKLKSRRKGNVVFSGLWALGREADHQALTRLVLPELLDRFPQRASEAGRAELNRSLLSALQLLDDAQAQRIVQLKLAQPGMDAVQRICWLVADLPYRAEAAADLAKWIGKSERRAVALGAALDEQGSLRRTGHRLSPAAVMRLIEVLAPITPHEKVSRSGGIVSVANEREQTVRGLLGALSSNPSAEARDALRSLAESGRLGAWQLEVDYSARTQLSVAREALFQAADPVAVALVIANRQPANAADLQALVVQHLTEIEAGLRGDETFLLRQFWQDKPAGFAPQDENFCRDLLLSKLKPRLNTLGVLVHSETRAARDKRADMRVEFMRSGKAVALPVEVKKENHDKLWTAWRDQLQALYTVDPAAGGYGLYLVLWFGKQPRATPEGVKPMTATQMRDFLVARIPAIDQHRLAVLVLDLSLPETA